MIFRQLFEPTTSTFTYLLACAKTKQAVIIDPVLECIKRDSQLAQELGLNPIYGLNTHVHADHITGTGALKQLSYFKGMKSAISKQSGALANLRLDHGDIIQFGEDGNELEVRATPGHTNGCLTYVHHKRRMAFTGDALLIRSCGRTDFQEGDARMLYRSVHKHIFTLPKDYLLYPAHDYTGRMVTTVEEELKFNTRLTRTEEDFVNLMENLKLEKPHQIDKSVPANLLCGVHDLMDEKLTPICNI